MNEEWKENGNKGQKRWEKLRENIEQNRKKGKTIVKRINKVVEKESKKDKDRRISDMEKLEQRGWIHATILYTCVVQIPFRNL